MNNGEEFPPYCDHLGRTPIFSSSMVIPSVHDIFLPTPKVLGLGRERMGNVVVGRSPHNGVNLSITDLPVELH